MATFGLLYLRFLGLHAESTPFAKHGRYLRDALVLANTSERGIRTDEPLRRFTHALFDETIDLPPLTKDGPTSDVLPDLCVPDIPGVPDLVIDDSYR